MATAAAAVIAKARRDVISHFMSADAVAPDKAVPFEPARRIQRRMFERFQRAGVIVEAKPGHYYLDVPAFDAANRARRRRLGIVLAGAAVIGAAVAALA